MTLAIIIGVAFGCWLSERLWPANGRPPLHFPPTCIGCSKRWACQESREREAHDAA